VVELLSPGQILVTAGTGAILGFALAHVFWRLTVPWVEALLLALVVAVSILLWRLAGNVGPLNEDPIAFVSPNDVLCPVVTYVCLSVYAGLRGTASHPQWVRIRAALTILSLAVNVVTI
jgi:hypothetical protein